MDVVSLRKSEGFDPAKDFARKSAKLLSGEDVSVQVGTEPDELQLQLPQIRDPIDTIVVINVK